MAKISVDTSSLSFPEFLIPKISTTFIDGSTSPPPVFDLTEGGDYAFQQASGYFADFSFRVTPDGLVEYDATFDGFLEGRGGQTLFVRGFPITLDGTALDHDLLPLVAGAPVLSHLHTHDLRLVPASLYGLVPGSGIVADFAFQVTTSGKVALLPAYGGFATANASTLTISGYHVHIDGRALSHDLLPTGLLGYSGGSLPRTGVNELVLIPAAGYGFQPGSGIVADMQYALATDGAVTFDSSCNGFLRLDGRDTLIVGGYPILIDATHADADLLSIVNIPIRGEARHYLFAVLVPAANYLPQTAHGVFSHAFNLQRDSTITFDAGVAGSYIVTTLPRLEIRGATPF